MLIVAGIESHRNIIGDVISPDGRSLDTIRKKSGYFFIYQSTGLEIGKLRIALELMLERLLHSSRQIVAEITY